MQRSHAPCTGSFFQIGDARTVSAGVHCVGEGVVDWRDKINFMYGAHSWLQQKSNLNLPPPLATDQSVGSIYDSRVTKTERKDGREKSKDVNLSFEM